MYTIYIYILYIIYIHPIYSRTLYPILSRILYPNFGFASGGKVARVGKSAKPKPKGSKAKDSQEPSACAKQRIGVTEIQWKYHEKMGDAFLVCVQSRG